MILTENPSQVLFELYFKHWTFDTIAYCSSLIAQHFFMGPAAFNKMKIHLKLWSAIFFYFQYFFSSSGT